MCADDRENEIDAMLERILRAAGSSLRHYTPQSRDALRRVMEEIVVEVKRPEQAKEGVID